MLPLLICWEHITHTYDKKTNCSYCAGALRAFLYSPASCHPPETRCLLSSDCSHSLPPIISPSFRPAPPLSPCIFLSLLSASRFSASFQAGFKQLYGTSKCPSLFRLFRKADNDIPNPADLQLIALFHQPSTVILCMQNSSTSSPLAVPPQSSTAHILSTRLEIFFFLLILISISAYHRCLATLVITPSVSLGSLSVSQLSSMLGVAQLVDWSQETRIPCQMLVKNHGQSL